METSLFRGHKIFLKRETDLTISYLFGRIEQKTGGKLEQIECKCRKMKL